ncbi:hypothetical protein TRFO_39128 [Tritrichomonas foetus]|uniref:Uncharacterized protein n=1 Tax=Tritrichomonas foetus TaxID=1144522 RepID=A0A1J4J8W4_9EUKA|nr:hypothetical protein TRFO_39128 [Tritrichomonas foetus]|eukprot:OHS94687.1 hypothetical protein TRFO_39128 [Tritrichomonas foetus]
MKNELQTVTLLLKNYQHLRKNKRYSQLFQYFHYSLCNLMWQYMLDEDHFYDLRDLPVGGWSGSKLKMKKNSIWMQFQHPSNNVLYNTAKPIDFKKRYVPPRRARTAVSIVSRNGANINSSQNLNFSDEKENTKMEFTLTTETLQRMNEEDEILRPKPIIPPPCSPKNFFQTQSRSYNLSKMNSLNANQTAQLSKFDSKNESTLKNLNDNNGDNNCNDANDQANLKNNQQEKRNQSHNAKNDQNLKENLRKSYQRDNRRIKSRVSLRDSAIIPTRHPYRPPKVEPPTPTINVQQLETDEIEEAEQIIQRSLGSDPYKSPFRISQTELRKQFRETIDEDYRKKVQAKRKFNNASRIPNIRTIVPGE